MANPAILEMVITKYNQEGCLVLQDKLAVEEPLEIRLLLQANAHPETKNISVTMRTPGRDEELALGFLFTEKIIDGIDQVLRVGMDPAQPNVVTVQLIRGLVPDLKKMERNFYTTSSCGVCGKASIEALNISAATQQDRSSLRIAPATIYALTQKLREAQNVFDCTGGLHAAALFDTEGNLLDLREDIGRHNAVDKLIGGCLINKLLPLHNHILMLSGRASFELLQKAGAAGIGLVASVGAPSSLAVKTAEQFGITLIGFLRTNGFNVYTHPETIM